MFPDFGNQQATKAGGPVQIIGPDYALAFGALAVAITRAENTGDFSECQKIIDTVYNQPVLCVQNPHYG